METAVFTPATPNSKRIFFSYGHDGNRPIVERFKKDLEARGHVVWIDYDRIGTWDDWRGRITEGILESEMAVAFLSVHSVRNPGVCRNEIAMALQRFGRVYPLLVEKLDSSADLPITLEHLQWPDLSGWRDIHDCSKRSGDFEKYYQARLAEVIEKIEGDATRFKEETGFLEQALRPMSFEGRFHQHLEGFIGRRWLFDAFGHWCGRTGDSRIFWLSAGPGFGKTAWAVNVAARNPAIVIATWFCQQGARDSVDPFRALCTLAFQLAQRLDDYRARLIAVLKKNGPSREELDSPENNTASLGEVEVPVEEIGQREGVADNDGEDTPDNEESGKLPPKHERSSFSDAVGIRLYLESKSPSELFQILFSAPMSGVIPRNHKHVFLIDGLDEACGPNGGNPLAELLDGHLQQLPNWVGAVVTSRPDPSTMARLGRYAPLEIQAGDERNLGDLRDFADRFLSKSAALRRLEPPKQRALVDTLVTKSEGMVLYLQRIAEAIEQGILDPAQINSIGSGISGLESQYLRDFQHRFATAFEEKLQPLLRLLLGAPQDPTEAFCAAVLGDTETVRRARIQLGSYITSDSGRLRLFHKTLGDWLAGERSSVFFTDAAKGRQQIGEFLWKCFAQRDRDSEDKRVRLSCEEEVLAWLPDLIPQLPQWRKAADLRAFGKLLNSRKRFKASVAISGRAYRIRKREVGASHKYTLRAGSAYGIALRESGDLERAEPLLREILLHRSAQNGDNHILSIQAMENLAQLLYLKQAYNECMELRRRVCELLGVISGPDSEQTQSAMFRLAVAEEESGSKEQALATLGSLLHIREEKFGFPDIRTLRVANRIAVIQRDSGDLQAAREMARRVVGEMQSQFYADDTYLLTNRSLLGNIEEKIGNLEEAEAQYRLALSGRLEKEPQAPSTILSLARLGSLLLKKGEFRDAGELLERAWKTRGGINSIEDRLGLELLDKLGIAWKRLGRRSEAVKLMRQNLPFFETGAHNLLYNLACYECLEGNLDEAKRLITEHLSLHPDMKATASADSDFTAINEFIKAL